MPILFQHFAAGVNAATHPRLLVDGALASLVNGTVSSGFCDIRPPFIEHEVSFLDNKAPHFFGRGVIQGRGFYRCEAGDAIIFAADGRLFRLSLDNDSLEQIGGKCFSIHSKRVEFCQRGPYLIAQDGESPPVIIRHKTVTQGTHPTRSVPCGTIMAEGWGRLAVARDDKIFFSNHIADPNVSNTGVSLNSIAKELLFTEDTAYFKNIRYFRVPESSGKIVGMAFTPSLNGDGDLGPLAVFCERSVWLYNTRVAREQWGEQDIASNPLPHIGACSPDSIVVRGNDVIFSDQTGRIQQMRIAVRRNDDARLKSYDSNVWPIIERDHKTHLNHRLTLHLPERHTLIAVHPEVVIRDDRRVAVRHRALLALNETPTVEGAQAAWDGEWTGIHPVAMITAPYRGEQTAFFVSLDSDGVNRIYRLGGRGPDQIQGRSVSQPMTATTRADTDQQPFKKKSATAALVNVGNAVGPVRIKGTWMPDGKHLPWCQSDHNVETCFNGGFGEPQDLPRLTLPAPPRHPFSSAQVSITITGRARLEEIAIETEQLSTPNNVAPGGCVTTHCRSVSECVKPYDLSQA